MACIKFSIFLLLFTSLAQAQSRFSSKSCLDASYNMKMTQPGPLFGLMKQEFVINKKNCVLKISHKKYLPKEWIIDVCREPVHIKVTSATGVDVAKKETDCVKNDKSRDTGNFCSQYYDLLDVIQDDGLIFAEGDRDNLSSDHGKTFCAYLLVRKYLADGQMFSRYTNVPEIFLEQDKPTTAPSNSPVVNPTETKSEAVATPAKN